MESYMCMDLCFMTFHLAANMDVLDRWKNVSLSIKRLIEMNKGVQSKQANELGKYPRISERPPILSNQLGLPHHCERTLCKYGMGSIGIKTFNYGMNNRIKKEHDWDFSTLAYLAETTIRTDNHFGTYSSLFQNSSINSNLGYRSIQGKPGFDVKSNVYLNSSPHIKFPHIPHEVSSGHPYPLYFPKESEGQNHILYGNGSNFKSGIKKSDTKVTLEVSLNETMELDSDFQNNYYIRSRSSLPEEQKITELTELIRLESSNPSSDKFNQTKSNTFIYKVQSVSSNESDKLKARLSSNHTELNNQDGLFSSQEISILNREPFAPQFTNSTTRTFVLATDEETDKKDDPNDSKLILKYDHDRNNNNRTRPRTRTSSKEKASLNDERLKTEDKNQNFKDGKSHQKQVGGYETPRRSRSREKQRRIQNNNNNFSKFNNNNQLNDIIITKLETYSKEIEHSVNHNQSNTQTRNSSQERSLNGKALRLKFINSATRKSLVVDSNHKDVKKDNPPIKTQINKNHKDENNNTAKSKTPSEEVTHLHDESPIKEVIDVISHQKLKRSESPGSREKHRQVGKKKRLKTKPPVLDLPSFMSHANDSGPKMKHQVDETDEEFNKFIKEFKVKRGKRKKSPISETIKYRVKLVDQKSDTEKSMPEYFVIPKGLSTKEVTKMIYKDQEKFLKVQKNPSSKASNIKTQRPKTR